MIMRVVNRIRMKFSVLPSTINKSSEGQTPEFGEQEIGNVDSTSTRDSEGMHGACFGSPGGVMVSRRYEIKSSGASADDDQNRELS